MRKWTRIFFIVALITGALGFFNLAGPLSGIMQLLFFVYLVAGLIALAAYLIQKRKQAKT